MNFLKYAGFALMTLIIGYFFVKYVPGADRWIVILAVSWIIGFVYIINFAKKDYDGRIEK